MTQTVRHRLAQAQAELVRALVVQGPVPAGFDENRVRAAARSLVHKRRQTVARVWPKLVEILGGAFTEAFMQYAAAHPLPACAAPLADGRAFLRWLDGQKPLCDAACIEALAFDLRYVVTPTTLRPRRGFALKSVKVHDAPGRLIGVRVPWLGARWWRIPRRKQLS
jgi:hypothetical protein